jgi:DNA-binding XRE family transcriptional regulator
MNYIALVKRSSTGWKVEFPDIPTCSATGASRDEALARAKGALASWVRQHLAVVVGPAPSRRYGGPGRPVDLPSDLTLAIELRAARSKAVLSRAELAQRAHVELQLIEDLERALTAPTLGKVVPIAQALGVRPVMGLERAGEIVGLTDGEPRDKQGSSR